MEFQNLKYHVKHRAFSLKMQCFGDVFEKNIDVDVFDNVLQNANHCAMHLTMLIAHPLID